MHNGQMKNNKTGGQVKARKIDRVLFFLAVGIVLAVCMPLILMAEQAGPAVPVRAALQVWLPLYHGWQYRRARTQSLGRRRGCA